MRHVTGGLFRVESHPVHMVAWRRNDRTPSEQRWRGLGHEPGKCHALGELLGPEFGGWDDSLMKATRVDPRDVTREVDYPTYRVYFWTQGGSASDEWRVTNAADVHEVLAWADEQVGDGRSYQVFVEATTEMEGQGLGLLRLRGADPTSRKGRDLM